MVRNALTGNKLGETARKMDREPAGRVFTTAGGGELDPGYCRRMIAKYAARAGIIKRVHFHLLRHTYLTKLYARTHDIRVTQQVAGHADISTTQIYTHVSGEDIRSAIEKWFFVADDAVLVATWACGIP